VISIDANKGTAQDLSQSAANCQTGQAPQCVVDQIWRRQPALRRRFILASQCSFHSDYWSCTCRSRLCIIFWIWCD